MKKLADAIKYGLEKHSDQTCKNKRTPYCSHQLGVASLILESGGSEDQAIGGILHDIIEDQNIFESDIEQEFGPTIARYLADSMEKSSKFNAGTNSESEDSWIQRKSEFINRIPNLQKESLLIITADKANNCASTLLDLTIDKNNYYLSRYGLKGFKWFHKELITKLSHCSLYKMTHAHQLLIQSHVAILNELENERKTYD